MEYDLKLLPVGYELVFLRRKKMYQETFGRSEVCPIRTTNKLFQEIKFCLHMITLLHVKILKLYQKKVRLVALNIIDIVKKITY
jgi:hypothetical protein